MKAQFLHEITCTAGVVESGFGSFTEIDGLYENFMKNPRGSMYGMFTYICSHLVDFYGKWDPMGMATRFFFDQVTNLFLKMGGS